MLFSVTSKIVNVAEQADDHPEPMRYTVLSRRAIAAWAVLTVGVGIGMTVWLLLAYGASDPRVQLDAIRTAGTLVVGAGGAAALLLAARRQRSAEIALKQKDRDQRHQERVAAATEADAAARRITELYTKAVEQLGSEKAPVRLGGFYALERLAQDNPGQRQVIVNVLCAYMRMPYIPPKAVAARPSREEPGTVDDLEQVQEREVRLAAQRLLAAHLRPGDGGLDHPAETFWPDIDLDLTGAVLIDLDLEHCHLHSAAFARAQFNGVTKFNRARFSSIASFAGAQFSDITSFAEAQFSDYVRFDRARFSYIARFGEAQFGSHVAFEAARFSGTTGFDGAHFSSTAAFDGAQFDDYVAFDKAQFDDYVAFDEAEFGGPSRFSDVSFARGAPAEVARFVPSPPAEAD